MAERFPIGFHGQDSVEQIGEFRQRDPARGDEADAHPAETLYARGIGIMGRICRASHADSIEKITGLAIIEGYTHHADVQGHTRWVVMRITPYRMNWNGWAK